MIRVSPILKESAFEPHELFFSTTNKRGVIQFGNSVFVRVSGYPAEKLLKAPHSIIRHPHMPRCVFKLFWDTIGNDKPIGAYVKNMASDGSYYWVYAVAFPIPEGYVSLRLKPTSSLFQKVPGLYQKILEFEGVHGQEEALLELLQSLQSLGFENYEKFMTHALVEEVRSRDELLVEHSEAEAKSSLAFFQQGLSSIGRRQAEFRLIFNSLMRLLQSGNSLKTSAASILSRFSDLDFLSINMAVSAAKVGADGKALAEISNGFRVMAEQVQTQIQSFERKISDVISGIEGSQFYIGSSRLQVEMVKVFMNECAADSSTAVSKFEDFLKNYQLLLGLCGVSTGEVLSSLTQLNRTLRELLTGVEELLSVLNGLEVIRLTGKVEAARLVDQHKLAFGNHLHEMTEFVERISSELKNVRRFGKNCAEELKKCLHLLDQTRDQVEDMEKVAQNESQRGPAAADKIPQSV